MGNFKKRNLILIVLVLSLISPSLVIGEKIEDEINLEEIRENFQKEGEKFKGLARDKNLIVLQVEGLQSFLIDYKYQGQEVLSNINNLLKEDTIYYSNYYELVGDGYRADAEFISNNSFYPINNRGVYDKYENVDFYSLASLLGDKGYETYLFSSEPKDKWNRAKTYRGQGYDEYYSKEDYSKGKIGYRLDDQSFLQESIDFLDLEKRDREDKFYAYLTTSMSHKPYKLNEDLWELDVADEDKDLNIVNYFQTMHLVDKYIGEFIDKLKEEDIYKDSNLVIQSSGHGIGLEDKESVAYLEKDLGIDYTYRDMLNIPLIVHIPDSHIKEEIKNLGSHLDFYPTLKNIMGVENEKTLGMGRDLSNSSTYRTLDLSKYERIGSYMDSNSTFILAKDGEIQNSRAYDIRGKTLVPEMMEGGYRQTLKELATSKYILENNLISNFKESTTYIKLPTNKFEYIQEDIKNKNIVAHAGGRLLGKTYTNSIDAIENSYNKGIRLMEIDFQWTKDERLVSTHSWDGFIGAFFKVPVRQYTYEEFINFEMINNWTQAYPELLEKYLGLYPDIYLITDIKSDNIKGLDLLIEKYPYMKDKLIPQVYSFEEYVEAEKLGFDKIILTLYLIRESDNAIENFAINHKPYAITMPKHKIKDLGNRLKNLGIYTYGHTVNDRSDLEKFTNQGIMGIYTDDLF